MSGRQRIKKIKSTDVIFVWSWRRSLIRHNYRPVSTHQVSCTRAATQRPVRVTDLLPNWSKLTVAGNPSVSSRAVDKTSGDDRRCADSSVHVTVSPTDSGLGTVSNDDLRTDGDFHSGSNVSCLTSISGLPRTVWTCLFSNLHASTSNTSNYLINKSHHLYWTNGLQMWPWLVIGRTIHAQDSVRRVGAVGGVLIDCIVLMPSLPTVNFACENTFASEIATDEGLKY